MLWVRAASITDTIAVRNALLNMDKLADDLQVELMVERLAVIAANMAAASNAGGGDHE